MPASYKTKIIAVGPSCSGKKSFFNSGSLNSFFAKDYNITIGVSIRTAEYSNENNDTVSMSIWDISSSERFRFIYPSFFRGAVGCLLFLNVVNDINMEELSYWVNLIRNFTMYVPIFLISDKADLNHVINYERLNEFIETNHIEAFFDDPSQGRLILNSVGRTVLANYGPHSKLALDFHQKNTLYEKFIEFFSICPVCRRKNHRNNLYQLFFSTNPELMYLKEKLIGLMEKSENFEDSNLGSMKVGILCCSCFNKFN